MKLRVCVQCGVIVTGLLVLALPSGAVAQETPLPPVRYDSSAVTARNPGPDALRVYRNDPDFLYDREPTAPLGLWDRFIRWLDENFFGPLRDATPGWVSDWFYYLLAAVGIAFAIARLLRMDLAGVFSRKRKQTGLAFDLVPEDIRALDFDRLIDEAVAARAYRRAVRLLYLKTLKALTTRNLIDWQRDKTNHEYIDELPQPTLRRAFAELTMLFEHVWYGDFAVDEAAFGRVRRSFIRFDEDVHAARAS